MKQESETEFEERDNTCQEFVSEKKLETSNKEESQCSLKKEEGLNGAQNQLLHPDSAKRIVKKRNYGAKIVSRIMRRGPRKKAGCAYEKRLSLEIKAAKTVAIVTGCFIFCWLGFSILYGLSFVYQSNEIVWSIVFWLGYLNSALNPVIYVSLNSI